jgi:biotin-dependent carboxylase-like uncharacterized protein
MSPVLKVLNPGGGCSLQDLGRPGWKRFGVPEGGVMDRDSAVQANRLADNPDSAALLELAMTGTRLLVLRDAEFALTGADVEASHPRWRSFSARAGEEICLQQMGAGVWSYLAVAGGFAGPRWFGSVSVNARAGFGTVCAVGSELSAPSAARSSAVAGRFVRPSDRPRIAAETVVSLWPGPEWETLPARSMSDFLHLPWTLSRQCDRTGYRLEGPVLEVPSSQMLSSPLSVGTVQLPPAGHPIVILRDGPTVGGYPRLAILDPSAVSQFTQCAPGTTVRFHLHK